MNEMILEDIESARYRLYNSLPTGEVKAFELIRLISTHLKELDTIIAQRTEETKTQYAIVDDTNAKLIAAAPDLLQVAKRVLVLLGNYPDGTMGKELADEANQAIKKATK